MADLLHCGVRFSSDHPPASDADLGRLQAVLGVPIPRGLATLLMAVNGGDCRYALRLADRPLPVCFCEWFSVDEIISEILSLEKAYFREQLPERFVPLALTGGEDDTLLIDLSSERYGQVLAWMTGRPPGWHRRTEDSLVWISSDLDALFDRLLPPNA